MSYHDQDFWVQREAYDELLYEVEELRRQLKAADEDQLWLEQVNTQLRQDLDVAKAEVRYLEEKLGEMA